MSIQYHKEIYSNDNVALQINFSGIENDIAKVSNLKMSFYAYRKSSAEPIFAEILNFDQITSLYQHLDQISIIKIPNKTISSKFVEVTDEIKSFLDSFTHINTDIIKIIFEFIKKNSEEHEVINALIKSLDELNLLEDLPAAYKYKIYNNEFNNLKKLLELEKKGGIVSEINNFPSLKNYIAGQPEAIFQEWIERNLQWIFGVEYKSHKTDVRKIALFSTADIIMESMDGFIDLIELKRPSHLILNEDKSHNSYYPSVELSKALGQCGHYLKKMDEYKMQLQHEHKIKLLRPRIKIIIGRSDEFTDEQYEALRMLNCNLNNIEIISYDYLITCGQHILSNLNQNNDPSYI